MIGYGIYMGERLKSMQLLGLLLATSGVVGLLLPGLTAPPLAGSILMLGAGVAWGIYSLRGRGNSDPFSATAGNFLYAAPASLALSILFSEHASMDQAGLLYAMISGAVTSGIGYAIWYRVLPELKATQAATVQLGVPVLAALGGILFLGEPLSLRLVLASLTILGGIALVIFDKSP